MQTFLPYPDFELSAQCLDRLRLGKQRLECKQIYLALHNPDYGWKNHPAVRMWQGNTSTLLAYACSICHEWRGRGYEDSLLDFFTSRPYIPAKMPKSVGWLGNEEFHRSHQSNLVRKDPKHYRKFFPDVPDNLPYIWPR